MRSWLTALAILVLTGNGGPGWATPLPQGTPALDCGDLAPFDNHCEDCCGRFEGEANPEVNLLPYEGRLEVRLSSDRGSWTWWCFAIGSGRILGGCDESPFSQGRGLDEGDEVWLECFARPFDLAVDVPPSGSYGCTVLLPDD